MKLRKTVEVQRTDEAITAHAGLLLAKELMDSIGMEQWVEELLPKPKSNHNYHPARYVESMVLMFLGGGNRLEDIKILREDKALQTVLHTEVPSSRAVGDWLHRMGNQGAVEGLKKLNMQLVQRALGWDKHKEYTVDTDATPIYTEKEEAKTMYMGDTGYMPLLSFLEEIPLCITGEFREGNINPAERNAQQIEEVRNILPKGKKVKHVRIDSAGYQETIINRCYEKGETFSITARKDEAVQEVIQAVPEHAWYPEEEKEREYAVTAHIMGGMEKAFKLIVERRKTKKGQALLPGMYHYHAIAVNKEIEYLKEAEDILTTIKEHRQRGQAENHNKELKRGIGLEYVPCKNFKANEIFFWLAIIAYNLFVILKSFGLTKEWMVKQLKTVRWWILATAGKVVKHARKIVLKLAGISEEIFQVFLQARERIATLGP